MQKLLVLFLFVISNIVLADWVSIGGPQSPVKSILKYDVKIYTSSYGSGVNAYDLDGLDWSAVNTDLANLNIWKATVFGKDMFVATDAGVYKLTNFTGGWKKVSSNLGGMSFYSIVSNDKRIYVSNDNNSIYYTTNAGTDWIEVLTTDISYTIRTLVIDKDILYVGCETGKIYKTTDDGTTWNEINNAPLLFDINDIKFVNGKIFAATKDGGMFLSMDGLKWSSINNGLLSSEVTSILSEGSNVFIATKGQGIYFTNNNGATWIQAVEGMDNVDCYTLYSDGTYLYTSTSNNEVMRRKLTEFNASVLETPVLTSPMNDAVDVELDNMFTWDNAKGALFYHIMISKTSDFSADNVLDQDDLTKNYCSTTVLEKEKVYYWKVASVNSTNEKKWSETRKFTTVKITDVNEDENNAIKIFPNPISEYLVLNTDDQLIDFVKIYSLNGELIKSYHFDLTSNIKLNIEDIQSGSYFAVIKLNGNIVKKKFVKIK